MRRILPQRRRGKPYVRHVSFKSDTPQEADRGSPDVQEQERQRLFGIRQALVPWENSNNTTVLDTARREIARSVARGAGVPLPETAEEVRRVLAEHVPPVLPTSR
jgi:hypothetical protein